MFFRTGVWRTIAPMALAAAAAPICAQTPPTHPHISYAFEHFRHKLDLYVPPSPCGPRPLVVYIHGGGWVVGDKSQVARYVDALLERGFAIASIEYRFSYQAVFPAQIHDCKGAIRWLRAHAGDYRLDPLRFAVFGDSAGAHLAALAGTSAAVASLEGEIGGNLEHSSAVQIVGDFAGPTDMFAFGAVWNSPTSIVSQLFGHPIQDIIDNIDNPNPPYPDLVALVHSADPAAHVDAADAPCSIVHGTLDAEVPPSLAAHLHEALIKAGVPSTLTMLDGLGHELPVSAYLPVFDAFAVALSATPLPIGDVNCDGAVNVDDLVAVILAWGRCPRGAPPCPDANGDGTVDVDDLISVILNWTG